MITILQHGRQDLVVWLVTNTRERDRLQTRDGDRCLLHAAAKYGQVRIIFWLIISVGQYTAIITY